MTEAEIDELRREAKSLVDGDTGDGDGIFAAEVLRALDERDAALAEVRRYKALVLTLSMEDAE